MNNKNQMHPQDLRNLLIFAIISICVWSLYETFILKPKTDAMERAKKAQIELVEKNPEILNRVILPLQDALKESERLSFENKEIFGSINLQGGRIDDLKLRKYYKTLEKEQNVVLLTPAKTQNARYIDYGWVSADPSLALPGPDAVWQARGNRELKPGLPVMLTWNNGQGLQFERIFEIDDEYVFKVIQRVHNQSGRSITLHPFGLVSQTGMPEEFVNAHVLFEGPTGFIGNELSEIRYKDLEKEKSRIVEADSGWIGITDKYWLTSLVPSQGQQTKFRFQYTPDALKTAFNRYQTDYTGPGMTLEPGATIEDTSHLFSGAKRVLVLEDYEKSLPAPNFDLAVDFGMFWFFTKPFFFALHFLGILTGNMGVAIIILTILIRSAVFPLTNISYKSFAKMKKIAPQMSELRKAYGDDKQKLQQAIVELYQREGVNPMSGCLPILVQIPIFYAFYKILFTTIEIRHAPFFGWIKDLSAADPTSIFNLFGILPYDVPHMLQIGVWPCLMLVAMMVQKRLNPPPQDKIQRDMMNYFPFIMTYVMAGFASGLVVYWTVSAIVSILQQMFIMRSLGVPIYIFEKDKFEEQLEKQIEEGPSVHPLAEMAEEAVEQALFEEGDKDRDTDPQKPVKPHKPRKKKKR